jgi:hypothetical protein
MEEMGALITFLKESIFEFLTEEHLLCRLKINESQSEQLILCQELVVISIHL